MLLRESFPQPCLPLTHYFISIARGGRTRTYSVRSLPLKAGIAIAALLGLWCGVSAPYLIFHDDLTSALIARQAEMQYTYEGRLADLRNQLDEATSRQLVDRNAVQDKVQALLSRQAQLEARASVLASFAAQASFNPHLAAANATTRLVRGPRTGTGPAPAQNAAAAISAPTEEGPALPSVVSGFAPLERPAPPLTELVPVKPRLEDGRDADTALPSDAGRALPDRSAPAVASPPGNQAEISPVSGLTAVSDSLDRIEAEQIATLANIGQSARDSVSRFDAALKEAGLSPTRLASRSDKAAGVGGPLVPLHPGANPSSFDDEMRELQDILPAAERLKLVLPYVPFRPPFVEASAVTSTFGPRFDPFTGRAAMHTGLDFGMEFGAPVRATAAGRVAIAAPTGGYGNMVEIDHGNGLSTRYGHLSAILVEAGQQVETGDVIGQVGTTGRSTGPHLHYETRIDGEPVDPIRFLRAGQKLFAAQ